MLELIDKLCHMAGKLSKLVLKEKDPETKKGLLGLFIMMSETIQTAPLDKELETGNALFPGIIEKIKETEALINDCKQKTRIAADLLDSLVKLMNEIAGLFNGLKLTGNPAPAKQIL